MIWQELSIVVPYEYVEPISYLFDRYGHGVSMEQEGPDQVLLRTYLADTSRHRMARIEIGVKLASLLQPLGELKVRPLDEGEDWQNSWKAHFSLLRVGHRLVIKPSWIEYQASPGDVLIELDPGMAFGTGYHPTTYTCLTAMETLVKPGMTVLDLGTGSGILTIAAIKLGAASVLALDIDPDAVRAARQNFRRLGILPQVALATGTVPHPQAQPDQFDLVVANISARAVQERAPFILPVLKPGGSLVASGIIQDQEQGVHDALAALGFAPIERRPREDWVSLVGRRPG
ncbi:MAG: 50S ribosomal protein L11 methyltransferase [SAR202 cluster bacterium]|nr:50S ribosomal protein L11 methyltransferase [SAR202 cluster bacterium]